MQRRSFLRGALALTALGGASVLSLARFVSYDRGDRRIAYMRALSAWQVAVVDALANRMCAADVAYDSIAAPPTPREVEVVEFIDAFIAESDPALRRDLLAAIGALEHAFPLLAGHARRFSSLSPRAQDEVLRAMETSSIDLVRGAFAGLKSVAMMGYFRDPRTWGVLGYDGPLVSRPDGGWVPLRYKP
jgi:hypothetical protein